MKRLVGPNITLTASLTLCLAGYGISSSDFQESLFATSNVWGTAVSSYEATVSAVVGAMPPDEECLEALVEWYGRLASYDESPEWSKSGEWAFEKGRMLCKFARNDTIAHSTNAWVSAARCLAGMRNKKQLLTSNIQNAISLTNLTGNVSSEWNVIMAERVDAASAMSNLRIGVDKAIPLIEDVVTNGFPRAILPTIEDSMRCVVVSNVAEVAGIKASSIWTVPNR